MKVIPEIEALSVLTRKQKEIRQEASRHPQAHDRIQNATMLDVADYTASVLEDVKNEIRRQSIDNTMLF